MDLKTYKYKFYLNATHFVNINNKKGEIHPHTWEITCILTKRDVDFARFGTMQTKIENILDPLQDICINQMPIFENTNPTTENMLEVLSNLIQKEIKEEGWLLLFAEISENPTCSYYIDFTKKENNISPYFGYKLTSFLNASHKTYFTSKPNIHNHTWEYIVRIVSTNNKKIDFFTLKNILKEILDPLQGTLLNQHEMFKYVIPTMEEIADEITYELEERLEKYHLKPIYVEINENSFCSFFIDKTNK